MDTMATNAGEIPSPDTLIERAARAGFQLVTRETDTGQVVWEWRRGLEPVPSSSANAWRGTGCSNGWSTNRQRAPAKQAGSCREWRAVSA